MIVHEIFGVTEQLKGVARRYAALGYDVAIPALFDRQQRDLVIPFEDAPKGRDLMSNASLDDNMADIDAAIKMLANRGHKMAVMGFCWGGGLALRSAQKLNIAAAITFYGTRLPQYLDSPLRAPLLGHFGKNDPAVPEDILSQAQAYLPDMEVRLYDAGHAFANDARPDNYVPEAAETAHQLNEVFLARHIG